MQLFPTNEIHYDWSAVICRQSPVRIGLGVILMTAAFCVPVVLSWHFQKSTALTVCCGVVALLAIRMAFRCIRNLLSADNWTMAIQSDGLLINLRSFHNRRFEKALTVLKLSYVEITSAQINTSRVSASMSGQSTARQRSLDLSLANFIDTTELKTVLTEESLRKTPEASFFGIKSSGRTNHVPARLVDERILRINWRGPRNSLTPRLEEVLSLLTRDIEILDSTEQPQRNLRNLTDSEFDTLILDLLVEGQRIEAIKLMRRKKGMGLSEAKAAIDELMGGQ